ncbi:hypothetical protein BN871_BZ_00120 [Paenibacillus sp. P22]|nr:hypothetical protein BN871_BZ_00120 [Paenibacillus sp. P22]
MAISPFLSAPACWARNFRIGLYALFLGRVLNRFRRIRMVHGLPRIQDVLLIDGQRRNRYIRRCLLAEQRICGQDGLRYALVVRQLGAETLNHAALGDFQGDVRAEIDRGNGEISSACRTGGGHGAFSRDIPYDEHALQLGLLGQHGRSYFLAVIRACNAAALDDMNIWIRFLDRLLERFGALLRDEEVCVVVDYADVAFFADRFCEDVCGFNAVAVVVGGNDTHIIFAGCKTGGFIVHEDELDALSGRLLVRTRRGYGVDRNADENIWLLGQNRLDIGHLRLGFEVRVRCGDDLNVHLGERILKPFKLSGRPVVSGIVHGNRRRVVAFLDLSQILRRERQRLGGDGALAVGTLAQDILVRQVLVNRDRAVGSAVRIRRPRIRRCVGCGTGCRIVRRATGVIRIRFRASVAAGCEQ